jgi:hypothetical protein
MLRSDRTIVFDTDVVLPFRIYDGDGLTDDELQALITAGTATEKDITSWDLAFTVRRKLNSADPPLIYKETGDGITLEGTFGGSPLQTVLVALEDTDTYDPDSSPAVLIKEGVYVYALKRLDAGAETVLAYGNLTIQRTGAWE